jgi:hypothetical protein
MQGYDSMLRLPKSRLTVGHLPLKQQNQRMEKTVCRGEMD